MTNIPSRKKGHFSRTSMKTTTKQTLRLNTVGFLTGSLSAPPADWPQTTLGAQPCPGPCPGMAPAPAPARPLPAWPPSCPASLGALASRSAPPPAAEKQGPRQPPLLTESKYSRTWGPSVSKWLT